MPRLVASAVLLVTVSLSGSVADRPDHSRLFKDARQVLAIAKAQGRTEVTVLAVAKQGAASALAKAAQAAGDIRYREDEIGYYRVKVPIDRVEAFADDDAIEAVTIDYDGSYPGRLTPGNDRPTGPSADAPAGTAGFEPDPKRPLQDTASTWPPRWSDYPLTNRYTPINEIDAGEMLRQHPTFDGRGVTIALLDGNFDFLLPEFQTAYSLDGKPIAKVADYLNVTDPRDDLAQMPQWVSMKDEVTAQGSRVTYQGKTYTTPRDGAFRIGLLDERKFNSSADYMEQDLDRDGNPRGSSGLFAILWDEKTNDVWVDTDKDLSFTNEKALTDYAKRPEFGAFGKDDPKTAYRDVIGFAVQTDSKNKFISINVGIYQHATEIMGSVVGNREPHGRLQGIAPGARFMSVYYGAVLHGMIEGLIVAFKHPAVDLIVLEQSVNLVSGPYTLADGRHPLSIVIQRLTDRYPKLVFVPGNNAPGFGYVAEDGAAAGAISVGGYQHRESYRINNGFVPENADNMHWGGMSHGPNGAGAIKPDLLAPSGMMGTDIGYVYRTNEQERRGLFQMPPGYAVDGGTSTATPMAAGATALVVSAAKQTNVKYDAKTLKTAITASARRIDRLLAHEQGNGLIQVGAAYQLLKSLQPKAQVEITTRAPVKTALTPLLATPNEGSGIYEREGWAPGDKGTRTVRLTRTSGPSGSMTFSATWEGNDGTFSSGSSVDLLLGKTVDFPVTIAPSAAGAHSAILTLDHSSVPGHAHRMGATIVAAHRLTADNKYSVSTEVTVPRPGDRSVFVLVPAGARALTFTISAPDGQVGGAAISPTRGYVGACPRDMTNLSCAVANPEPGVWEINVSRTFEIMEYEPSRPRPVPANKIAVTASLLGVGITPGSATLANGGAANVSVNLSNQFAATTASLVSAQLGSAFQGSRTIARGEIQMYEVTVPAGAGLLRAAITNVTPNADLDIYLIDCSSPPPTSAPSPRPERDKGNKSAPPLPPNCAPRSVDAGREPGGAVEVENPKAGRWVVVVDGYSVPSGGTKYDYLDLFTHPKLGSLTVDDFASSRAAGASWTSTAHLWAAGKPDGSRVLMAHFVVRSSDAKLTDGRGVIVGTADVPLSAAR